MDDTTEPGPRLVGVYCDAGPCDVEECGDYLVRTAAEGFAALRRDLNRTGWSCDQFGDYCPQHAQRGQD